MRVRVWVAMAATGIGALALASPASAALECGDTITQDKTLKADLDCSATGGTGLEIDADDVTLDLDGHEIRGGILALGIHVNNQVDVTIKNGDVRDFQIGVLVQGSARVTVKDMDVRSALDHAIEVDASDDVTVADNVLRNTEDLAGLRVAQGSGVAVTGNEIDGTGGNGMALIDSGLLTVTDNTVVNAATVGVFLSNVSGSALEDNTVTDVGTDGIVLADDSLGMVVDSNTIKRTGEAGGGSGIQVDPGAGPNRVTGNEVIKAETDGIFVGNGAESVLVRKNFVERAAGNGIRTLDTSTVIQRNTANQNDDLGIDSASSLGSGNKAKQNGDPAQCVPASLCA